MEKDQKQNSENELNKEEISGEDKQSSQNDTNNTEEKETKKPEEIILELEDKLARTFAEMENQRRRYEKEKVEAFEYGVLLLPKRL